MQLPAAEGPSSAEKAIFFPDSVSLNFNAILLQLKNRVKVKVELSRLFLIVVLRFICYYSV